MMQQINPGLMKVLAAQSQINPLTPEGNTSVAANVLAQAGQAPGIAAIGQQAHEALPSMMRNAQDDQAKQMLEAANRANQPAGIAGLNIPMGQFAEGGVVGYNGKDDSFVDQLPEGSGLRRLVNFMRRYDEFDQTMARRQAGEPDVPRAEFTNVNPQDKQANVITTSGGLTTEAARGKAPKEESKLQAKGAPRSASGVASLTGTKTSASGVPGADLYEQARREYLQQLPPEAQTALQRRKEQEDYLRSLGLPTSLRPAEEARLKQMEEFDAQTRAQIAKQNKEAMQGAWMSGILKPAQNLARMFSGAAEGMLGEEGKQREQAVKDAALQRQQMLAANAIRTKLDEADRLEALGDVAGARAARETARTFENTLRAGLSSLTAGRAKDVAHYGTQMDVERMKVAAQAAQHKLLTDRQNELFNLRRQVRLASGEKAGPELDWNAWQDVTNIGKQPQLDSNEIKRAALANKDPEYAGIKKRLGMGIGTPEELDAMKRRVIELENQYGITDLAGGISTPPPGAVRLVSPRQ